MTTLSEVGDWLISEPIGVLVLGAAGSLLATGVLRFLKYSLSILRQGRMAWSYREFKRGHEVGFIAGAFSVKKDPFEASLYIGYRIARLLIALTAFLSMLVVFSAALPGQGSIALTGTTFFSGMFAFLAARLGYEEYAHIRHLVDMSCSTLRMVRESQNDIVSEDET